MEGLVGVLCVFVPVMTFIAFALIDPYPRRNGEKR